MSSLLWTTFEEEVERKKDETRKKENFQSRTSFLHLKAKSFSQQFSLPTQIEFAVPRVQFRATFYNWKPTVRLILTLGKRQKVEFFQTWHSEKKLFRLIYYFVTYWYIQLKSISIRSRQCFLKRLRESLKLTKLCC